MANLHHNVTADFGTVRTADDDQPVDCVRLTFHPGNDGEGNVATHGEEFVNPSALPALIDQLVDLAGRVVPDYVPPEQQVELRLGGYLARVRDAVLEAAGKGDPFYEEWLTAVVDDPGHVPDMVSAYLARESL